MSISQIGLYGADHHNEYMPDRDRYDILRQLLLEARYAKGFKQVELAGHLGKPQSFVSKYETGERRLDVVEFLEVCDALSVRPETILEKINLWDMESRKKPPR